MDLGQNRALGKIFQILNYGFILSADFFFKLKFFIYLFITLGGILRIKLMSPIASLSSY